MRELVAYWQGRFDWRTQEAQLNELPHFRAEINGLGIHFVHARGEGSKPLPIVLTHGWPGSFFEFAKLIPLLTQPAAHGAEPADAFDIVVPSLPGFAFSERPTTRGVSLMRIADLWAKLMSEQLGYARFAAGGSDFGAILSEHLASRHPEKLVGLHVTYIGYYQAPPQDQLSEAERRYVQQVQAWVMREGGYALVQATRPQTLAFALNDSAVGLAAWLVDKFRVWTDCDGDIERCFTKDELLTHVMLYWVHRHHRLLHANIS